MDTPLATLEHGACRAEIYETALPGQFSVRYLNADGSTAAEEPLTGVSTYKQREQEILNRIGEVCKSGGLKQGDAGLSDSGEY